MSLDVMKQALEALESNPDAMVDRGDGHWDFKRDLAITALRAAIEQAQGLAEKIPAKGTLLEQTLGKVWDEMPHTALMDALVGGTGVMLGTWEKCQAEAWQEPVRREAINNIRVRIMQEAYDLADRGDSEGYNSVKVMCSDVLGMINKLLDERKWQGLTNEEIEQMMDYWSEDARSAYGGAHRANGEYVYIPDIIRDVEKRLKEKNDG